MRVCEKFVSIDKKSPMCILFVLGNPQILMRWYW